MLTSYPTSTSAFSLGFHEVEDDENELLITLLHTDGIT